jgi:hypothetical protein
MEEAKKILVQMNEKPEIQKSIDLAIKFEFIDDYLNNMVIRAQKDTDKLNTLLEYIEYFTNPETIISQYGPDVKIGDISENLTVAFTKLNFYMSLI